MPAHTIRHPNQVNPDWLDALSILQRAVDGQSIAQIWDDFYPAFRVESHPIKLVSFEAPQMGVPDTIWITLDTEPAKLARIERIELLTYAACCAWMGGSVRDDGPMLMLCRRAGCYWKNTPSIRERWTKLDYFQPAHLLPNACFEDRPRCQVCTQPVATGAGAMVKSYNRPDLHQACLDYAHRVMVPMAKGEVK